MTKTMKTEELNAKYQCATTLPKTQETSESTASPSEGERSRSVVTRKTEGVVVLRYVPHEPIQKMDS